MVLVSVDPLETSKEFSDKLGLTFAVASDPEMKVIDTYGVRNQDVPELALHSIFMVDREGKVFYRKIARRRAKSQELLYALDRAPASCCPGSCTDKICELAPGE